MQESLDTVYIAHAELRMLQSMAATMIAEATQHAGISRCRFGRFKLVAQCIGHNEYQDKVTMELIVLYNGMVIEHDKGSVFYHS